MSRGDELSFKHGNLLECEIRLRNALGRSDRNRIGRLHRTCVELELRVRRAPGRLEHFMAFVCTGGERRERAIPTFTSSEPRSVVEGAARRCDRFRARRNVLSTTHPCILATHGSHKASR